MLAVTTTAAVMITVTLKSAAALANLGKVSPAVLRLTAAFSVLSDLFVKIFFSLSNAFVAVAPLVRL
jgi:hypothetical protein